MTWEGFTARMEELSLAVEDESVLVWMKAAEMDGDVLSLRVTFEGHDELGVPVGEAWLLRIEGVYEHRLQLGLLSVDPQLCEDHPRLRAFAASWQHLYYAAPSARPDELISDLLKVHDPVEFGPFGNYGPYGQPRFGAGLLASGPEALMAAYTSVLQAHEMRPSTLPTINPLWPPPYGRVTRPGRPRLLNLSGETTWGMESFVLGSDISVRRLLETA